MANRKTQGSKTLASLNGENSAKVIDTKTSTISHTTSTIGGRLGEQPGRNQSRDLNIDSSLPLLNRNRIAYHQPCVPENTKTYAQSETGQSKYGTFGATHQATMAISTKPVIVPSRDKTKGRNLII